MEQLILQTKTIQITNKNNTEISLPVYYVVVNNIEVMLKPNDYTCKAILENYFKELKK